MIRKVRQMAVQSVVGKKTCPVCSGNTRFEIIPNTGPVFRCVACGKFVKSDFKKTKHKKGFSPEKVLESVFCTFDKAFDRIADFFAWLPKRFGESMLRLHKNCIRAEDEVTNLEKIKEKIDKENNARVLI